MTGRIRMFNRLHHVLHDRQRLGGRRSCFRQGPNWLLFRGSDDALLLVGQKAFRRLCAFKGARSGPASIGFMILTIFGLRDSSAAPQINVIGENFYMSVQYVGSSTRPSIDLSIPMSSSSHASHASKTIRWSPHHHRSSYLLHLPLV